VRTYVRTSIIPAAPAVGWVAEGCAAANVRTYARTYVRQQSS